MNTIDHTQPSPLRPVATPNPKDSDAPAIAGAAKQFEALLIGQILKAALSSDSEGWLGTGEDQTASSMMELAQEHFAQSLTAQGGMGLASMIVRQLNQPSR